MISIIDFLLKTAEVKSSNEKTSSADAKDGMTNEEMIRMNIEKMKKRAVPKPQKTPASRSVHFVYALRRAPAYELVLLHLSITCRL